MADLSAIPITSKTDLQSLPPEEVIAHGMDPKHLITHTTSGSSGEPFTLRRTWFEERLLGAFRLRALHYFGLRVRDRTVSIALLRPTHSSDFQLPLRILQALGLYHKVQIDCLLPPQDILHSLRDFRPDVLTGFSGVISHLAQIMNDNDRQVIHPRFVLVGAEVLTPLMRHQITKAFGTPVFELYGSHEFNLIAWECKRTGELHTCDDNLILEVVNEGRPAGIGERGEVVGTNLHSFAMPFIRYRLGDIVTKGLETCQCGQPFSTIRAIQGRMIDYFPLPGGRVLHPYEILAILRLDAASWIRQYQLIQEREDRIILKVVPSTTPQPQKIASVEESVTALLGRGVEFQVVLVPEIQLEPSGKFRVLRSLVNSAYEGIDWERQHDTNPYSQSSHGNEQR
ncbi:MAG: phenylacetate--CoA ligase family protein [Thermodesulfobacteriota bacterium]